MIRGTTPTLTFTLPFSTSTIRSLMLTFSQSGKEVFTLEKEDCTLDDTSVIVHLTQEQTLKFLTTALVEIQMRVLTTDNQAIASEIITCSIDKVLKDGELT